MYAKTVLLALLLAPVTALAAPHCKHSAERKLDLDLAGVKRVKFEVNSHDLRLRAAPGGGALGGRACASHENLLENLVLTQQKQGDTLVVSLRNDNKGVTISLGGVYTNLEISGTVPDDMLVQLKVGSGDATISGAQSLSADVGSGDVEARDIKGLVTAAVGSGDLELTGIGSLNLLSLGSGDVSVTGVRGNAEVGTVGSGDLELEDVGGDVKITSLRSGDIDLVDVRGNVTLGALGSGELDVRDVGGDLQVTSRGSGSVRHSGVAGKVSGAGR
jgi:Uncharacterized conserved protein